MEELECLELRQKLKERFRKKMKKELGSVSASSCRSDNFGSFFGPSQPIISQRVIQEMKSLLENPDLAAKIMRKNNIIASCKVHMLKYTRDYSFLLSDDVPAPSKPSLLQKGNSDSRSAPKNQSSTVPRQNPSKLQPSISKQKKMIQKPDANVPKVSLPQKGSTPNSFKSLDVKRPMPNLSRQNPSKLQPSISKQKKMMPSKPKMIQKPAAAMSSSRPAVAMQKHSVVPSSKPQVVMQKQRVVPYSRPPQPPVKNPAQRPAKRRLDKEEEEEEDGAAAAISMIRQMFGYNPNRYRDDDDDSAMEAGFDDILKEERRSAKIARKEDEEELRKIQEEEQMRRQAKKRKMT
ncbi:PREDICTED: protein SPT2 homolog [Ipomoea nil]|uniref:protein SPT2 homolog n=1 Tax=Ipomoea nil TaxID=35883 RepID=UPI0009015CC4|nr:PREDICTED: protein SPT2 homolog [Ipomoea nil]